MKKGTGIDFRHISGDAKDKPFPAANGSGVAALDFDLDGFYDLVFASGQPFPLPPREGRSWNRLYRNLGGWSFSDVTEASGLTNAGYSAGLAAADFNSDGFADLYISCFGVNRLYENLGDGTFQDVTETAGVGDEKWGTSAAFVDCDQDGLLDLYVCNYAQWTYEENRFCGDRERNVRIFCNPSTVRPEPDRLFRNLGDGTFRDVTDESGLTGRPGRAQGILAADVNADGFVDLYVGNDLHPNSLFLNDGTGRFQDASETSGTAYSYRGVAQAGMGVAGADVNRDGFWDLIVTNFEAEYNTLYVSNALSIFEDRTRSMGLADGSRPWVGWGAAFADFDLDGWQDLLVTNGHVDNNLHLLGRDSRYDQPATLWRNSGTRFQHIQNGAGSYFDAPHPGRGLSIVDLDNDLDLDVVITHQDQPPALLRNERHHAESEERVSVVIRLIGTKSNRDAIGTVLRIPVGNQVFMAQVQGGGSYLSAQDLRLVIPISIWQESPRAEVRWPSGAVSVLENLESGGHYVMMEPGSPGEPPRSYRLPSITSR